MPNISPTIVPTRVSNGHRPKQGLVASLSLTLVPGVPTIIDLRQYVSTKKIDGIQGLFIDLSQALDNFTSFSTDAGQSLSFAINSQVFTPLFLGASYTITINGSGPITLLLLNFEPKPVVYPANQNSSALIVTSGFGTLRPFYVGGTQRGNFATVNGVARNILDPGDAQHRVFLTGFYLSTFGMLATTAGRIQVTIGTDIGQILFQRQLWLDTIASGGSEVNARSEWDVEYLQLLMPFGAILQLTCTAVTAVAPFAGSIEYTITCGISEHN